MSSAQPATSSLEVQSFGDVSPSGATSLQPAQSLFAIGMIGLGVLALIYGDYAMVWQPVPAFPGRTAVAYAAGVLMLLCGIGLLFEVTKAWAARVLLPYLVVWALLKVPALFVAPKIEAVWLGLGELTVLLAGGWVLFCRMVPASKTAWWSFLAGESGIRAARVMFAVSLIPIGMSHLFYGKPTADLVPAWLPFRIGWAYLTGAGQIACGLGVLFGVFRRLAATAEAAMISVFTLLVWLPAIFAAPKERLPWTAFFISWVIAAAAWVVAQDIVGRGVRAQKT